MSSILTVFIIPLSSLFAAFVAPIWQTKHKREWGSDCNRNGGARSRVHALVLEEADDAGLDGFLGGAWAGLADLVLVPGQLLVQLLDLLVHRLPALVHLPSSVHRTESF